MAAQVAGGILMAAGYAGSKYGEANRPHLGGATDVVGTSHEENPYAYGTKDALLAARMRGAPQASLSSPEWDAYKVYGSKLGPAALQSGVKLNRDGGEGAAYQGMLAKQLYDASEGKGPSVANLQMHQGLNKSLSQQLAAAGAVRGVSNTSGIHKALLSAGAASQQQVAADSASLRAQEIMGARGQLGGLSTSMAGQQFAYNNSEANLALSMQQGNQQALNQFGLAQAGFDQDTEKTNQSAKFQQASMDQQVRLANMQSQLQKMGLDDAQIRALLSMQQSDRQFGAEYGLKRDMYNASSRDRRGELAYAEALKKYQSDQAMWGTMMNAGGSLATAGSVNNAGSGAGGGGSSAPSNAGGGSDYKSIYGDDPWK